MTRRFTIKERIDLVRNYYSSGNNASEAARKAGECIEGQSLLTQLHNSRPAQVACFLTVANNCVGLCKTEWQSSFKTKEDTSNIFFSLHYLHLFAQCDL